MDGVFPEGSITPEQQVLADEFSSSLINHAYRGNPSASSSAYRAFTDWPSAYGNSVTGDERDPMPSQFNLFVVDGPYGTHAVHLDKNTDEATESPLETADGIARTIGAGFSNAQQQLASFVGCGSMSSGQSAVQQRLIEQQKLFQRWVFMNGLAERLGV